MKKYVMIIVLAGLFSCRSDREKQISKFAEQVNSIGIEHYDHVEYMQVGEQENYNYLIKDTVFTQWKYDRLEHKYKDMDTAKMLLVANGNLHFADSVRFYIQKLQINSLTQSEWNGLIRRFWLTDAEIAIWVSPEFRFDSPDKIILENELKNSIKINDNWYYKKLSVCRNR